MNQIIPAGTPDGLKSVSSAFLLLACPLDVTEVSVWQILRFWKEFSRLSLKLETSCTVRITPFSKCGYLIAETNPMTVGIRDLEAELM